MGLLKKLFSETKTAPKQEQVFYEQHFTQSHSFKGYKRFNVSRYGYAPAERGFAQFCQTDMDLEGADIHLKGLKGEDYSGVQVNMNGILLGTVFVQVPGDDISEFFYNKLFKGKVSKAHVRIDNDRVYLFLKAE